MKIAVDTCVVIGIMEGASVVSKLRKKLKGKQYKIVLCRQVLWELRRVRNLTVDAILGSLRKIFGERRVGIISDPTDLEDTAQMLRNQYHYAHNGDHRILATCRIHGIGLMTLDRGMLKVATMVGIPAFHPKYAGGI